jgi:hypothetical protein
LIHELAALERASASDGERIAAERIAEVLGTLGCETAVEQERAHGGYWWPLGLANVLALGGAGIAACGRGGSGTRRGSRGRAAGALLAAFAAAAIWDDVGGGSLWFRRALLPHRPTWNVIAHAGDRGGERTVVFIAHHDAAHSGLVFHPRFGRIAPRVAPRLHERSGQSLPILYTVWLGPVMICAGAALGKRGLLRAGALLALGASAAMADIGARKAVPGANDNLSAVGVLVAIAAALARRPVRGLHVVLVSTGSEESFMEGMQAFARRHFREFDRERTEFVCLECLGGPTLMILEGEGMLRMRDYPAPMRDAIAEAATRAGVRIERGLRTVAATDALIALRAGLQVATLASVDYTKLPLNYHWPSDTPEALHWETIEDSIALCERFVRDRQTGPESPT